MDPNRHQRISELFAEASRLEPARRAAFLAERSGDDAELRAEVASLLEHHERPAVAVETGAFDLAGFLSSLPSETAHGQGTALASEARYTIVRELGEGGMGMVYLAEQDRPRRTVALKVMRPGFASTERLRRRFEFEAEVLGRLEHPGIARIYDAGSAAIKTPTGTTTVPYFAMEYVDGLPLVRHAAEAKLGSRERVRLMARIADAVGVAHRQGIVHRDLKPANILVDRSGQPKVLDFGVARATDADLAVTTMQTDVGQLIGTLAYMSPEQVAGDSSKIDVRSDVYALGAVTWELLAGRPLVDATNRTMPEVARVIRDEDASRLSAVDRVFRGDLETIVAKALEKDPGRRYRDASEFAADLERYLRDEPIVARPPTTTYQLAKFARRNKALVGGVAVAFVLLVLGLVGTSIGLVQAHEKRNEALAAQARADHRFDELRKLAKTFIYEFDDLIVDLPGSTEARKKIVSTATAYLDSLSKEAADDKGLLLEVSEGYMRIGNTQGYHSKANLGDRDGAMQSFQKALELRERMVAIAGDDDAAHVALAKTQNAIGNLQFSRGELEAALATFRSVEATRKAILERNPGDRDRQRDLAISHQFVGNVLRQLGNRESDAKRKEEASKRFEESLDSYRQALALAKPLLREGDALSVRDLTVAEEHVGDALGDLGRREEALEHFRASLEAREKLLKADPDNAEYVADCAAANSKLGAQLLAEKRLAEAEPLILRSLELALQGEQADAANVLAKVNVVVSRYRVAGLRGAQAEDATKERDARLALLDDGIAQASQAKAALERLAAENKLEESKKPWIAAMEEVRAELAKRREALAGGNG